MNIFGAFTFGSLIKTFLPGFVWLIAFGIAEIDVMQWLGKPSHVWEFIKTKDQSALVLAIPASILLGLLSNVTVFMGLNDLLVRTPFKRDNPDLVRLHEGLARELRDQSWSELRGRGALDRSAFDAFIDTEIILVERIGFETLAYIREQYWYHLEFQLNLLLSLIAVFVALIFSAIINDTPPGAAFFVVLWVVVGSTVCFGLLQAARRNYSRHIGKMASLMAALLSAPPKPPADA